MCILMNTKGKLGNNKGPPLGAYGGRNQGKTSTRNMG